ncbi:MAG: type II toxin-antitoxin system VapC family toxin, partial [Armatimonadetes bacterium]|nr:type II toxin-antitoxin system VapC family toxin [Armatimonadota bacterium]
TGEKDALIAAVAQAHGAVLVTHNTRHYSNIAGLDIDDWVDS